MILVAAVTQTTATCVFFMGLQTNLQFGWAELTSINVRQMPNNQL